MEISWFVMIIFLVARFLWQMLPRLHNGLPDEQNWTPPAGSKTVKYLVESVSNKWWSWSVGSKTVKYWEWLQILIHLF